MGGILDHWVGVRGSARSGDGTGSKIEATGVL